MDRVMARAMYPKCTMPAKVLLLKKCTTSPSGKSPPELIREEVARRMIIPANINHTNLEPMCIGIASKCKVNANIGASPNSSHLDEEVDKLNLAVKYGADTVMDLHGWGALDEIRTTIINASPVPIGTVPVYQALESVHGTIENQRQMTFCM